MKNKLQDYVLKIDNFLTKDLCKKTVTQLKKVEWTKHYFGTSIEEKIYLSGDKELEVSHDIISNKKEIMNKLHSAIQKYLTYLNFDWYTSWSGYSDIRFNKYVKNRVMAKHCDHITSMFDGTRRGIPTLSCLGTLNDNYTGGEFILLDNKHIELKAGELLIFPSNFMYPHEVKPVTKGTRYSYISWVY